MAKKSKKKQAPSANGETGPEEPVKNNVEVAIKGSEEEPSRETSVEPSDKAAEKLKPNGTEPTAPAVAAEVQPTTRKDASLHQEIGKLTAQLEAVENERDDIQEQYDELLEKVAHIKTTLGQRLKSDAAELARVKEELEASKKENAALSAQTETLESQNKQLTTKYEKDHAQLGYIELQLGEERAKSEALDAKVAQVTQDMEQQTKYAEHYRKAHQEASASAQNSEQELTKKLNVANSAVTDSQAQLEAATVERAQLQTQVQDLTAQLEQLRTQQTSVEDLNETVREKNILIGKLRHEAVILNEHLTNALRIVKKDSEGQTVDKELVSNLIVQFVTIPRGDTKKFEVLQLIASFLNWDEDRRIEAGISRSQHSGGERSLGGFLGKFAEFMERESRKS